MEPTRVIRWDVTAIDEFGRKFNCSYMTHPLTLESLVVEGVHYRYTLERTVRSILKEMGEAAWAEWTSEEREEVWNWNV